MPEARDTWTEDVDARLTAFCGRGDLRTFIKHYVAAALWSSTDDDSEPLDQNYTVDDIADEAWARIIQDCAAFLWKHYPELTGEWGMEQAGHDFWLTRNRHGTGFWDRGKGKLGRDLAEAAMLCGECDVIVGDNGKLFFE